MLTDLKVESIEEISNSLTGKIIGAAAAIHEEQLLSYLKLSDCKIGLLINFNMKILKDGIRRFRI